MALAGHSDACNWTYLLKLAFAERLALTVSVQVELVPVQAPDQPVKFLPCRWCGRQRDAGAAA